MSLSKNPHYVTFDRYYKTVVSCVIPNECEESHHVTAVSVASLF